MDGSVKAHLIIIEEVGFVGVSLGDMETITTPVRRL